MDSSLPNIDSEKHGDDSASIIVLQVQEDAADVDLATFHGLHAGRLAIDPAKRVLPHTLLSDTFTGENCVRRDVCGGGDGRCSANDRIACKTGNLPAVGHAEPPIDLPVPRQLLFMVNDVEQVRLALLQARHELLPRRAPSYGNTPSPLPGSVPAVSAAPSCAT